MNISKLFIIRPVATALLMVAVLLSGWIAYRQLPVSALPQVDYPTIQIVTFYPGASPDVMVSSVTAPLERQFGQIPGLSQMSSSSSEGCSVITLRFLLEMDIDIAVQQVQASINVASNFLPRDIPNPPIYSKVNPADAPILTFALTSDSVPLARVQDLADTRLAQKLSQVSGVGQVSVTGGQKPAVRVQANPTSLSAMGLTLEDVRSALATANVNLAKGSFDGPKQAIIIGANDQLFTADQFRELIVSYRNGAPVKLGEVANVIDDVENIRQFAWHNTTPAVLLNIQRQPGANIIEVVDRIYAMLPQLKQSLPASVGIEVLTDRTVTIRASIESVKHELLFTIGLVVLRNFLVSAQCASDNHSKRCGASIDCGYVRRDVSPWLHAEQSDFDGADYFDWIRGRRCDCNDRKHHALCRRRRTSTSRFLAGLQRDRFHHCFAKYLADRCTDSFAIHGRRGR